MLSNLFNFFKTEPKFEDGGATISESVKSSEDWEELRYLKSIKNELIDKYGDGFAVIVGNKLIGVYPTVIDARRNGVDALGFVQFSILNINGEPVKMETVKLND